MKKIIALILAMTMVLAFAACGAKAPQQPTTGSDISTGDEPATMPENDAGNEPATMPEDNQVADDMPEVPADDNTDNQPADMPEDNTDDQPATMPEDNTDDQPATMPEDNTDDQPATMPEDNTDDQPATMPEDNTDDQPADMPEDNTDDQPATMPEDNTDDQPADMPEEPSVDENGDAPAMDEAVVNELYVMIDAINAGVELPMVGSMALDAEMFPYFAFIEKVAGVEAVVSEAMIGSIAHSIVLYKCADGVDVNAIAAQVQANANPRKWVCVEAEKTAVIVKGSYILLVMSNTDTADALIANFNSL